MRIGRHPKTSALKIPSLISESLGLGGGGHDKGFNNRKWAFPFKLKSRLGLKRFHALSKLGRRSYSQSSDKGCV